MARQTQYAKQQHVNELDMIQDVMGCYESPPSDDEIITYEDIEPLVELIHGRPSLLDR